jgi:hypothetical protein
LDSAKDFPNEGAVVATAVIREELARPGHDLSGVAQEDVFQELRELLGQYDHKGGE